jgi:hypothetical protein
MLNLSFIGRFESRIATDPEIFTSRRPRRGGNDLADDDPDFDRLIRTMPSGRPHKPFIPPIGVFVYSAKGSDDLSRSVERDFLGARFRLLPEDEFLGPFFDARNQVVAANFQEPISIIDVEIALQNGAHITRASKSKPTLKFEKDSATIGAFEKYFPDRYVDVRKELFEKHLSSDDAQNRSNRINLRQNTFTTAACTAQAKLDHTTRLNALAEKYFDKKLDAEAPWKIDVSFSRYDFDSMSGAILGNISIASQRPTLTRFLRRMRIR